MNKNTLKLFNDAKNILIVTAKNVKIDSIAAVLALGLAAVQQGKSTKICTEADSSVVKKLVGSDKISTELDLGGNILKVSFPYTDGSIDKVTYNITDDHFNLLIEPRQGVLPLKAKQVQYSYTGGQIDLIITIDTPDLKLLGNIYLNHPDLFQREKIINIGRRFDSKQFGVENIIEKNFSSTSEIVLKFFQILRWDINPDIATNLYAGLISATNNFTSFSANAQSFEVASFLLKNGARKITLGIKPSRPEPRAFKQPDVPKTKTPFPDQTETSVQPASTAVFSQTKVEPKIEKPEAEESTSQSTEQPPQDWLKPKIFKSTDLV